MNSLLYKEWCLHVERYFLFPSLKRLQPSLNPEMLRSYDICRFSQLYCGHQISLQHVPPQAHEGEECFAIH
jgi:hypothetical protein